MTASQDKPLYLDDGFAEGTLDQGGSRSLQALFRGLAGAWRATSWVSDVGMARSPSGRELETGLGVR